MEQVNRVKFLARNLLYWLTWFNLSNRNRRLRL